MLLPPFFNNTKFITILSSPINTIIIIIIILTTVLFTIDMAEVGTVSAEDFLDDGTPIRLSVTIDRRDGNVKNYDRRFL